MTSITYDMQKLDEAVSVLVGSGPLRERLRDAVLPLLTLHHGPGMHNPERSGELTSIVDRLTGLDNASDEHLGTLARDIVDLCNGNWHDTVFALDDEIERLTKR